MPQRRFVVMISGQNCQVRREGRFNYLSGPCPSRISHSIARILLGEESAVTDGTSLLFRKCAPYRSLAYRYKAQKPASEPSITVGLLPRRRRRGYAQVERRYTSKPSITVGLLPRRRRRAQRGLSQQLRSRCSMGVARCVAGGSVTRGSSPTVMEGSAKRNSRGSDRCVAPRSIVKAR